MSLVALLLLVVLLGLALRSRLPTIVPDMASPPGNDVQLEGAGGALTSAQGKAIVKGVQGGSPKTGIFERHLAREEAITNSPLTTGNHPRRRCLTSQRASR